MMFLNDFENVPVERSPRFIHSLLCSGFTKGLAWETCSKDVARWHIHRVIVRIKSDISEWIDSPVQPVNLSSVPVNFRRKHAFTAQAA